MPTNNYCHQVRIPNVRIVTYSYNVTFSPFGIFDFKCKDFAAVQKKKRLWAVTFFVGSNS